MGRILRCAGNVVRGVRGTGIATEILEGVEQRHAVAGVRRRLVQRAGEVGEDIVELRQQSGPVGRIHRLHRITNVAAAATGSAAVLIEQHQADVDVVLKRGDDCDERLKLGLALNLAAWPVLRVVRPVGGVVDDDEDIGGTTPARAADEDVDVLRRGRQ